MEGESKGTKSLRFAVSSPRMWDICRAVEHSIGPLVRLHGWVKGCECHSVEERRPKGKLQCPMQGVRAPHIAAKVDETIRECEVLRDQLHPGQFGSVPSSELHSVIHFIIAMLVLKLRGWLHDLPYLIWQDLTF